MFSFVVPAIPPSNNKYLGNSHSHHIYGADKKYWNQLIWAIVVGKRKERPMMLYSPISRPF